MSDSLSSSTAVACPRCRAPLEAEAEGADERAERQCPRCGARVDVLVFPRLRRTPAPSLPFPLREESDAACVFHPELKAEVVCEECGAFLSRKAAVNWAGLDYCMPCLHHLREEKREKAFRPRAALHDNRALAMMVLLLPLSMITAPLALFFLLRHRDGGRGFVPRSGFRWWLALALSVLLTLGWVALLVAWLALLVNEWR